MAIYINLIVEDELHVHLLKRVLKFVNPAFEVQYVYGCRGNAYIRQKLFAFNQAAHVMPYLALTDLDQRECPSTLISEWIDFQLHPNLLFRVAVREADAWLLADRKNMAEFLGVSASLIEPKVEAIADPKEYIGQLARRSRKRAIRTQLEPVGSAVVGKEYNSTLADFIVNHWDVTTAQKHARSLQKLVTALREFKPQAPVI